MIRPNPHIAAIAPYALADLEASGSEPPVSLAQNESIRPPSPMALEAAARAMAESALYPDPDWSALREAISGVHQIPIDGILCGAGSMELIAALAKAYSGSGSGILGSGYGYAFFRKVAEFNNAPFDDVPENNFTISVDALLSAANHNTSIVFVANPGNPTGTRITRDDIVRLRDTLHEETLLVVDEAYGEFADGLEKPLFDLVKRGDTVVLRTFSKAYGLAGMRVGWGLFPPAIAAEVRKLLNPNNIAVASQAAAAAAMADQAYMRETCALTADLRESFSEEVRRLALTVPPSHTNFVLMDFADADRANSAETVLRNRGILLRGMAGYGLPNCLRATIGSSETMDRVAAILTDWHSGRIT